MRKSRLRLRRVTVKLLLVELAGVRGGTEPTNASNVDNTCRTQMSLSTRTTQQRVPLETATCYTWDGNCPNPDM
jgi:hypothetical protein